ncbi:hypothetical protein NEOLEDRAFT_1057382 [Neolentinus lepideus HHB14362 ss-1]|uniref:Golgi apparatus membrane protein TVP38 n=1 Tax=Neolentinus lepideus HHB14362 ss-1 TaxID=1314782 RepID=A0A165V5Z1_9AGAM|nr:hypothetical protein NEOLEDRAFT_1057382 [Neolentinus lepideus HHB14362 ss-1]
MESTYAAPTPIRLDVFPLTGYTAATSGASSKIDQSSRDLNRTPSPTPSDIAELSQTGFVDWSKYRSLDYWKQGPHLWYLLLILIVVVLVILSIVLHTQILHWLQPFARWMHNLPAGWLIPVAILFVLSFPPLFGHELVAILCGMVWGIGPGFGIVALGTFLGEWGNYVAFKYYCRSRAEKMEKSSMRYGALARAIRDGGFIVVLVCRYSIIPAHLTTAVFSTCGVGFLTFTLAAVLSLPKQLVTVYMGVLVEQSGDHTSSRKTKLATALVLIVTIAVTIFAMRFMRAKTTAAREQIIYERRRAR